MSDIPHPPLATSCSGIVRFFLDGAITRHPLFRARGALSLEQGLAILDQAFLQTDMVILFQGLSSRIRDDALREHFSALLSDELGRDAGRETHATMLADFVAYLGKSAHGGVDEKSLERGSALFQSLKELYLVRDVTESLGTAVAVEIMGSHVIDAIARNARTWELDFSTPAARWLTAHEVLEPGHLDGMTHVARLLDARDSDPRAFRNGAAAALALYWEFAHSLLDSAPWRAS